MKSAPHAKLAIPAPNWPAATGQVYSISAFTWPCPARCHLSGRTAWGAKVIDHLAADLKEAFPDMGGLSSRNLLAMKIFAREFPDGPIAQQPVAQLPWAHVLQIMQRAKAPSTRDFYIRETLARKTKHYRRTPHRADGSRPAPLQYQSGVNPPALRKRRGASAIEIA